MDPIIVVPDDNVDTIASIGHVRGVTAGLTARVMPAVTTARAVFSSPVSLFPRPRRTDFRFPRNFRREYRRPT